MATDAKPIPLGGGWVVEAGTADDLETFAELADFVPVRLCFVCRGEAVYGPLYGRAGASRLDAFYAEDDHLN